MAERGLRGVDEEQGKRRQPSDRGQPFDPQAERALLGAALLSADARRQAVAMVTSGDLWVPLHARLFDAIVGLHRDGGHVDALTVREWLDRHGAGLSREEQADLVGVVAETPATSNVVRYARIVAELAALRRALLVGQDIVDGAYARPADVAGFLDRSRNALQAVETPVAEDAVTQSMADFLAAASPERDWVIPLFLERGERMLLIAGEGVGKAVLMRQLAIAAAQGVHPFMPDRHQPAVRTLLIDLENPADIIRRTSWRMERAAQEIAGADYDPDRCTVWHETAGIDLRSGADFARVDEVLNRARPALVCVGPLYKLFRKAKGESDEDAALDVCMRLDDLRARHRFALVIEHHAPKGDARSRELVPFGSSVWMRWPEFGPALHVAPNTYRRTLLWGSWRPGRDERPWPTSMSWGTEWAWHFHWDDGPPTAAQQRVEQPRPQEPPLSLAGF